MILLSCFEVSTLFLGFYDIFSSFLLSLLVSVKSFGPEKLNVSRLLAFWLTGFLFLDNLMIPRSLCIHIGSYIYMCIYIAPYALGIGPLDTSWLLNGVFVDKFDLSICISCSLHLWSPIYHFQHTINE